MRRALIVLPAAALALSVLMGCGEDKVAAPDVVGLSLDKAHQQFEALGVDDFDDADNFGDRGIRGDAGWAVISQDPAPGRKISKDLKIVLKVGKLSEQNTLNLLPENSIARQEAQAKLDAAVASSAAKAAADAEKAEQEAAERATEYQRALDTYVDKLDPAVRIAQDSLREIGRLSSRIRSGEVSGIQIDANVLAAMTALDQLDELLDRLEPSDAAQHDDQHDGLREASAKFRQATLTLLSADGSGRKDALDRAASVAAAARTSWNDNLKAIYQDTDVKAPLIP